jgi:hypothetical protein
MLGVVHVWSHLHSTTPGGSALTTPNSISEYQAVHSALIPKSVSFLQHGTTLLSAVTCA